MAEQRIASLDGTGLTALGAQGQLVVDAHRQLTAILKTRLGPRHAALLARPERATNGPSIDYYAAGPATPFAMLPAEARAAATARRDKLINEIIALADRLMAEGDASALVGHLLKLAVLTPSEQHHMLVNGEPVLTGWGHAATGQAIPALPERTPPPPSPPAVPALSAMPAAELASIPATPAAAARRGFWGWLGWLLPLLLGLILLALLLKACEPLPAAVVDVPGPATAAVDPTLAETDRAKALQAELAALKADLEKQQLASCVIPPADPPPPQRTELPPPPKVEPPPVQTAEAPPPPPVKPTPPKVDAPAPKPPVEKPPAPVAQAPTAPPVKSAGPSCPGQRPAYDAPEVILVVDGSGSMDERFPGGGTRMSTSKQAIGQVVRNLPGDVDVGLVDFTDCNQVRRQDFYSPSQRDALMAEVNGLRPDRGTPLARSIERAANIASGDVETTLIIVTDGEDTCHGDPCAAARAAKAKKPQLVINVIDLEAPGKNPTAQCIAQATGGKVLRPNDPIDYVRKLKDATGSAGQDCK